MTLKISHFPWNNRFQNRRCRCGKPVNLIWVIFAMTWLSIMWSNEYKGKLFMVSMPILKFRLLIRYALLLGSISFAGFLAGCVYDPVYYGPPPHRHYHPHYYDYYYYPHAQVYFHFTTGIYYYRDGGVWVTAKILPPHIHIDAAHRVRIRVESDRPYLKFNEHIRIHRPEPNYRIDPERSRKEREANRRWHQEYKKKYPQGRKKQGSF